MEFDFLLFPRACGHGPTAQTRVPRVAQCHLRCWVVERIFGWLGRSRRLSRDYERKAEVAEAFVYLAMCRLMLYRWIKN